jgi:hypothetical protein
MRLQSKLLWAAQCIKSDDSGGSYRLAWRCDQRHLVWPGLLRHVASFAAPGPSPFSRTGADVARPRDY